MDFLSRFALVVPIARGRLHGGGAGIRKVIPHIEGWMNVFG